MKCRGLAVVLALALAACGDAPDAPAAEATPARRRPLRRRSRRRSGPERRILAFGDSLFAGYGLDEGEGYPDGCRPRCARAGSMRG